VNGVEIGGNLVALTDSRVFLGKPNEVGSTTGRDLEDRILLRRSEDFNGRTICTSEEEESDLTGYK